MLKVERLRLFVLPGLVLVAVYILNAISTTLMGIPVALAANQQAVERHCTETSQRPAIRSATVIDGGEVICSDITSFGGSIVIRGIVQGNVVSFGGNVVIGGTVNGNVKLYGGNVTLQKGSYVNGDIHLCGGNWIEGTSSQLHGAVIGCQSSIGQLLTQDSGPGLRLLFILIWIAVGSLLIRFLPEHVMLVRTTARIKVKRSLVLGFLSVLLAPVVLIVLTALIISIPLAIIVAIGLILAWMLGIVAVGWLVGDYIVRHVLPQHNTRQVQIVVGLTVLVLAESLPYIGLLISVAAGLIGLGAVLLSRFGTRLYSQPRQPLTL